MLVVDTSAILAALVGRDPSAELIDTLAADADLHAPHLIDIEFLRGLRRLAATAEIADARAEDARLDFAELTLVRYPHTDLVERIWTLRHNLTAYDAAFVALAEALGTPLVTCDSRIASAPGHEAEVLLFHP
jgi:predicted nucleic acid-binding protein